MRPTKISLTRNVKINIGNYETTDLSLTVEGELEVDESIEDAYKYCEEKIAECLTPAIEMTDSTNRTNRKAKRYGLVP